MHLAFRVYKGSVQMYYYCQPLPPQMFPRRQDETYPLIPKM